MHNFGDEIDYFGGESDSTTTPPPKTSNRTLSLTSKSPNRNRNKKKANLTPLHQKGSTRTQGGLAHQTMPLRRLTTIQSAHHTSRFQLKKMVMLTMNNSVNKKN